MTHEQMLAMELSKYLGKEIKVSYIYVESTVAIHDVLKTTFTHCGNKYTHMAAHNGLTFLQNTISVGWIK